MRCYVVGYVVLVVDVTFVAFLLIRVTVVGCILCLGLPVLHVFGVVRCCIER